MTRRVSPELLERLAAEYTLGTMTGGARRRFERAMREDAAVAAAALRWQHRLLPLDARVAPLPAGDALWQRIESSAFGPARAAPAAAPQRWWQRLFAPIPAGALALGVLMGTVAPGLLQPGGDEAAMQLPESYVGVLATADGKPGLIVSSLRRGTVVDLKRLAAVAVPAGQTLFLWTLDAQGRAGPVGPLPEGALSRVTLAQPAEALFQKAVELAVSLEPVGATPAQPGSAFVYRGLCGKLWPPPRPTTPSEPPR